MHTPSVALAVLEALGTLTDAHAAPVLETGAQLYQLADGVAAQHSHAARYEAARKLITNHVKVLADVTNHAPVSQLHLVRVSPYQKSHVDRALFEAAPWPSARRPRARAEIGRVGHRASELLG